MKDIENFKDWKHLGQILIFQVQALGKDEILFDVKDAWEIRKDYQCENLNKAIGYIERDYQEDGYCEPMYYTVIAYYIDEYGEKRDLCEFETETEPEEDCGSMYEQHNINHLLV